MKYRKLFKSLRDNEICLSETRIQIKQKLIIKENNDFFLNYLVNKEFTQLNT